MLTEQPKNGMRCCIQHLLCRYDAEWTMEIVAMPQQYARMRALRLAYPGLICGMLRLTLCAGRVHILEGGESAIMFHIPPVVCVSWGPGSWRDVSHTDLPLHNRGVEVDKGSRGKGECHGDVPSLSRREDMFWVRDTIEHQEWTRFHFSIGVCIHSGHKLWQEVLSGWKGDLMGQKQ